MHFLKLLCDSFSSLNFSDARKLQALEFMNGSIYILYAHICVRACVRVYMCVYTQCNMYIKNITECLIYQQWSFNLHEICVLRTFFTNGHWFVREWQKKSLEKKLEKRFYTGIVNFQLPQPRSFHSRGK